MSDSRSTGQSGQLPGLSVVLEEAPPMDIFGILIYLLRYKWIVLVSAIVVGAAGAAYALMADPWYRSRVVLVPARSEAPTAGLGQLGGLASLAGINLSANGSDEANAVLRSEGFATGFLFEGNLAPVLVPNPRNLGVAAGSGPEALAQARLREAVEYFRKEVFSVAEDTRAGTVTIQVQWRSAEAAAEWANSLASRINARMRSAALDETEANVAYLQREMASTNVVALQQSLGRVLETQLQKMMVARGAKEYAFKVVDSAVPARKRYRPQRTLIVILSSLAGCIASICALLIYRAWNEGMRQRDGRN